MNTSGFWSSLFSYVFKTQADVHVRKESAYIRIGTFAAKSSFFDQSISPWATFIIKCLEWFRTIIDLNRVGAFDSKRTINRSFNSASRIGVHIKKSWRFIVYQNKRFCSCVWNFRNFCDICVHIAVHFFQKWYITKINMERNCVNFTYTILKVYSLYFIEDNFKVFLLLRWPQ